MRAPFLSEREGYEFLFFTVAAFSAVAVASVVGGAWVGVPVWALATAAAVALYVRRDRDRRAVAGPAHVHTAGAWRILVLALEPLGGGAVGELLAGSGGRRPDLLVSCPASVSALRHWMSDVDAGRTRAERTLGESLAQLRSAGIAASGAVGDEEPLRAVEDALRTFDADEIVVAAGQGECAKLLAEARGRFGRPVRPLVVPQDGPRPGSPAVRTG